MKIPPKEANLFLKSDICKEFEWLVLELDKYKIPELKEKDFEKLSLQYQMFLEQNWYSLFKRTQKEWKIEKRDFDSEDPDFRCQLCNRPHLHKLSTIVNVINNNELTVGSICIKDFDYILHNSLLDKKIYNEEKRKEAKKLKVIEYILGYNPEVMYKIKYFKSVFNTTNWILNEKLEEDKININKLLERDFYPQLEVNKIDNVNLKKVSYSEKRINKFLEEFDNYKTFCKTDEWGINSQVATWCFSERNKDKFLIKDLMSDGKITVNTVDRIIEPHFLKKIISIFKNQITMINFKILSIQEAIFIGYFIDKDNVKLEINNSSFIKKYKTNLFNKNEEVTINIMYILDISKVSRESYGYAVNYIVENSNRPDLSYQEHVGINELAFRVNGNYYVFSYNKFIENFKYKLFNTNEVINLSEYFLTNDYEVFNSEEYDEHLHLLNS